MDDINAIKQLVNDYKEAIHNQDEHFFKDLWTQEETNTLISIKNQYVGIDCIYQSFLIDKIQASYKDIVLIADSEPQIHFIHEELAIVIFQYHTECIKRDTLEKYGIQGLETQVVKKVKGRWKLIHIHYSK
jgi:hypothetical protein